jgi:transposase
MAMGTRKSRERQEVLWYRSEVAEAPGHPFYRKLEEMLKQAGFDKFCERECKRYYADGVGRPSLAPGVYFRLMLIGFFEGLDSERGIAWRVADSLSLREFLGYGIDESTPDHVTVSRTRRLFDTDTHQKVFSWVLEQLARAGLVKGKTMGVDSTTLEANAAMRSIVRRETGENYLEFLKRVAAADGETTPDAASLRRMDRKRKKKTSNEDWASPADPEAEITKLKDGRTGLAYKVEQAVDMETGAIVAVTTHGGAAADSATAAETLCEAGEAVAELISVKDAEGQYPVEEAGIAEVVADKGYHSNAALVEIKELGAQRFEAGDDVEQFLVDAILAQTMKCPVEVLQQFVDVFVGALHRRQAARVLAREGFGARPEERDEKIFADERPQGRGAAAHDLGQVSRRPGKFGQLAPPAFVQRQQSLADGRIDRPGRAGGCRRGGVR